MNRERLLERLREFGYSEVDENPVSNEIDARKALSNLISRILLEQNSFPYEMRANLKHIPDIFYTIFTLNGRDWEVYEDEPAEAISQLVFNIHVDLFGKDD